MRCWVLFVGLLMWVQAMDGNRFVSTKVVATVVGVVVARAAATCCAYTTTRSRLASTAAAAGTSLKPADLDVTGDSGE